jgi:hypothetical protein
MSFQVFCRRVDHASTDILRLSNQLPPVRFVVVFAVVVTLQT